MHLVGVVVEDYRNGKVTDTTDMKPVHVRTAQMQSTNDEILYGISSAPPWYIVIAYALQVRVLRPKLELSAFFILTSQPDPTPSKCMAPPTKGAFGLAITLTFDL